MGIRERRERERGTETETEIETETDTDTDTETDTDTDSDSTYLRAHETGRNPVCRSLLEKKTLQNYETTRRQRNTYDVFCVQDNKTNKSRA